MLRNTTSFTLLYVGLTNLKTKGEPWNARGTIEETNFVKEFGLACIDVPQNAANWAAEVVSTARGQSLFVNLRATSSSLCFPPGRLLLGSCELIVRGI